MMLKLFPAFDDKNVQIKHDTLIGYALFLFIQSIFTGYSTYNVGPDKSAFLIATSLSFTIPILIILFARKNYKLVSNLFIGTVWTTSVIALFVFKSDNSGMAYLLADLFIKAALASLTIRWYTGIFYGLLTILVGILDLVFEKLLILNFLQIEPIPPMAYLIGFSIMLGTLGIIAIANALSFEKIFIAYQSELAKRKSAEELLIKQNIVLDQKVKERTREIENLNEELTSLNQNLHQANEELIQTNSELIEQREELSTTLNKLQTTQEQLIQSEKMASLGVLASGIAHEINNPLNFIASGIFSLENYLNEKLNGNDAELEHIRYVLQTGLDRSESIITSLNRYSRKDESVYSICNLHSIIDSCLMMLQNQTKYRIDVQKNYTTENSNLLCNESKMHQAVLNILANAVQSIPDKGKILIETKLVLDIQMLTISDTGCGIEPLNMPKIFDPFFTTKEPGKGTGLGLSITYNILKEHNATIEYQSEPGIGTTVILKIPVKLKEN